MRHADHGAFHHSGQFVQHQFDLLGVDVVPPRNDQVLPPAHDLHVAVFVDAAQIPGDEKPVLPQFGGGLFRHVPVALKHVRPAHLDHANVAGGQGRAGVGIRDLQFHAGKRQADRTGAALTLVGVRCVHVGFRHPVAFEDAVPGTFLEPGMGFRQQGGAAGDEKPHMRRAVGGEIGRLQQAGVEGRHPHERRGLRHEANQLLRVGPGQEDHATARQQDHVGRHEEPVGMEDRQGMQQDIRRGEGPFLRQGAGIGEQVALAQHRALGTPRRAGSIEKGGQIRFCPRDGVEAVGLFLRGVPQAARACAAHGFQSRAGTFRDRFQRLLPLRIADQQAGAGIRHEIFHLGGGIGGVEGQKDQTRLYTGRIKRQRIGRFTHLYRHPVPGRQAHHGKDVGVARRHRHETGIADQVTIRQVQKRCLVGGVTAEKFIVKWVRHGHPSDQRRAEFATIEPERKGFSDTARPRGWHGGAPRM